MRIFENPSHDFLSDFRASYITSGILLVIAIVSLFYPGLEAGIDFTGGTEFVVESAEPIAPVAARQALDGVLGDGVEAKEFGDPRTLLVRTGLGGDPDALEAALTTTLAESFPGSAPDIIGTSSVGPRIASDLKEKAIFLVLGALFVILLYIFVRFDWRFAVAAVLTLAHDVLIVLGLFALLHNVTPFSLQIDQVLIAALLTIVGYSINDTVVVFDRIREYTALFKTERFDVVANRAINTTLSRTVLTSGTTLLTVFILFLIGGEVLKGFSLALLVGIAVGTYSSIFVASPLVVWLRGKYAPAVRGTRRAAAA
ncbi:protein translocase subunit SecF [Rubrivirga sp. S365]|uniref:Protein-export membrane protein SecF n=1 Tax=Rubrivirga litoralis TaxID=3075598 RepID=A0ABU3BVB4_9BACT|nr:MULTISPECIES: protein translocase subunit SecF [unclassified Rubrivirga]MDT0633227.1 protein translocase subunit SecF [Rubrivirga sp. F394]MDT7856887.1 protein translocase subunit SecF [Rubrivirga sp. S365]